CTQFRRNHQLVAFQYHHFLTTIGAAALVFFALWEWHSAHPLLELRFLRRRNFLIGAIGLFITALFFRALWRSILLDFS
ncbi:drug resistance transporter, EmrB/QacA family protein, partial [Acidithiobacillus sp. GGI-221]